MGSIRDHMESMPNEEYYNKKNRSKKITKGAGEQGAYRGFAISREEEYVYYVEQLRCSKWKDRKTGEIYLTRHIQKYNRGRKRISKPNGQVYKRKKKNPDETLQEVLNRKTRSDLQNQISIDDNNYTIYYPESADKEGFLKRLLNKVS